MAEQDDDNDRWAANRLLDDAVRVRGVGDYIGYNDHPKRTHAEVLAMFDRAIALAKERGL
jgi:hypothetical protein